MRISSDTVARAIKAREDGKLVRDICAENGFSKSFFYAKYREYREKMKVERPPVVPDNSDASLEEMLEHGLSSGEKLERLKRVSEILTDRICEAACDDNQFTCVISSEGKDVKKGKATSSDGSVRRLDVKEIKEMASTVRVLTDCVRSLYGIPTFGETSRLYLAGKGEKEAGVPEVTVKFIDGVDFSE